MRVADNVAKTIAFVGIEGPSGFVPLGTAFICIYTYEDMAAPFIVTARHILDDIAGEEFSVRLNRKDGTAETRKLNKNAMIKFDDKAIDIAVITAPIDHSIYDVFAIHLDSKKWKKQIEDTGLGAPKPGDEVCISGLYTTHFGTIRNMPVVRIGHIAAIPEEKVLTNLGYVNGFLVEVHSIVGLSGSPVFWNLPWATVKGEELKYRTEDSVAHIVIGVFVGYHVVESREDEMIVPQFQTPPEEWVETDQRKKSGVDERRTGFGVVLPIHYLFGMFDSEEMKKLMSQQIDAHRKGKCGFQASFRSRPS